MNLGRFLKKCLTNPPAAWSSAKLVARSFYAQWYWSWKPRSPLVHHLSGGGVLLLEPGHSFTYCFYPGVDTYEPDVSMALKHLLKAGHTFIDCGANVGYFSILAAQLVQEGGTVVSIEANPSTYSLLKRNLSVNGVGIPVHCALTTQKGEVELFMPIEGGDVYSSLHIGGLLQGQAVKTFQVQGRALDEVIEELKLSQINLIKIDVEGAELEVLRSANHLLSHFRPLLIMEYSVKTWSAFGATAKDLEQLLERHSYKSYLYDKENKCLVPTTLKTWQENYVNVVLVPEEH
jgi:FkbM family methyltransferase